MEGECRKFVSNVSERSNVFMRGNVMKKLNVMLMVGLLCVLVGVGSLQATPFTPDADTLFLLTGDDMHATIPNYYYAHWGKGETSLNMGLGGSATGSPNQVQGHEAGNMAMDCFQNRSLRGPDRKNFGNTISDPIQQWTFETWVKVDDTQVDTGASHNGAYHSSILTVWQEFHLYANSSGGVSLEYFHTALNNSNTDKTTIIGNDDTIWDGQWHYIAVTGDHNTGAGELKLYIDRALDMQTSITVGNKFRDMQAQGNVASIRVGQYNSSNYFPGAIDDIRLSQGLRDVPEPATIALLTIGVLGLLRRKQ